MNMRTCSRFLNILCSEFFSWLSNFKSKIPINTIDIFYLISVFQSLHSIVVVIIYVIRFTCVIIPSTVSQRIMVECFVPWHLINIREVICDAARKTWSARYSKLHYVYRNKLLNVIDRCEAYLALYRVQNIFIFTS